MKCVTALYTFNYFAYTKFMLHLLILPTCDYRHIRDKLLLKANFEVIIESQETYAGG